MADDNYYLAYRPISGLPTRTGKTDSYIALVQNTTTGRLYKQSAAAIGNTFENTVVVKSASDLTNIDSTKNYMLDGVIDMGSQSIEVPTGGISISGLNGARDNLFIAIKIL